jgi:hypothetical protein
LTIENTSVSEQKAVAGQGEQQQSQDAPKKDADQSTDAVQPKKDLLAKRKARQPKFDGNLIPEEGDESEHYDKSKSPGPLLEPISQNLDDSHRDKHETSKDYRDILGAQTPDKIDMTLDDEYQELEVDLKPTREELIAKYQETIAERDRLQNTNNQMHHKLADYFRKRKTDDQHHQPLFDKSSQEQEQRYLKYLSTIENLRKQIDREKLDAEAELDDLKIKTDIREAAVDRERMLFVKMKKDTGIRSVSSQTGKVFAPKEVDFYLERERAKEREVISVRIENIKLKNQLKKKENELKAKEEFGEGLHMIDFEQLKIENQTYNEKIEERNEELMKLKKKINNTVQILTHVKEKLQFVNAENEKEKGLLSISDEQVKRKRDILSKIKQSRDSLRMDNNKLKQNSGLLGNNVLLRDFENCVDKNDNLESRIEHLKRKHAELILTSKGIKQKIAQTKTEKSGLV